MANRPLLITPQTKIGDLLQAYPDLEDVLIAAAPAFKKLRNPVLRRTVAKITSVAQAARVGGIPVTALVARLRDAAGQEPLVESSPGSADVTMAGAPAWFDAGSIVATLDARPLIDAGEHPLARVMQGLGQLSAAQIYELITAFEPAPLIDTARSKGYTSWTKRMGATEYRTYFKAGAP